MENTKTIEILKTAILLEKRGESFYRKVAAQTEIPEVAEIFITMANEEVLHTRVLSEKFREAIEGKPLSKPAVPESASDSLTSLVLSREIRNKISAAGYEAAAISAAIDMENKAIEIYSERAQKASDPNERALFQWLADWEKTHHKILHELDTELKEKIWNDSQFWPF